MQKRRTRAQQILSPKIGAQKPQNGWFISWKHLLKWDDLGVPLFLSRLKFSQKWLKKQSHYIKFSSGLRIIREDGSFFTVAVWPRARVLIISNDPYLEDHPS